MSRGQAGAHRWPSVGRGNPRMATNFYDDWLGGYYMSDLLTLAIIGLNRWHTGGSPQSGSSLAIDAAIEGGPTGSRMAGLSSGSCADAAQVRAHCGVRSELYDSPAQIAERPPW
jgi:hypothetical protein